MSIVRHTCILLCWMLLTSIIVSCDPFHEDEIADGKGVTINPERTEYYLPDYLYPNPSVVINLGEIVMFTFETISIRVTRSEEHTSELQSRENLVCRLL